ncbi:MAG: hypothetical protein ACFFB3_00455 [Candidatus Hodarchaeota archaeon]
MKTHRQERISRKKRSKMVNRGLAVAEEIIELPKGLFFDLKDIFELQSTRINENRSLIALKVIAIPPAIATQSCVAWEIDDYLQDVYKILFSETRTIENEYGLRAIWIFERFANQCLQIVPNSQKQDYIERLVAILTRIPQLCPDLFALVWEPRACWQENRERGINQEDSWIKEL